MSTNPTVHKQLFLDDSAVSTTAGVTRRLHHPHEQIPVLRPNKRAGQVSVQSRSAPQWNPERGLWEWWYWGYYRVPPHGPYQSTEARLNCYATSPDGIHWETPSLGLVEWQGSRANNIVRPPDAPTLYHVLRDEYDPDPARRYKGLFGLTNRRLGISPDGLQWSLLDVPPIPSEDESHFLYDPITQRFLAYVKQPTAWGRSVWLATSQDFQRFTTPQLVFHADETDRLNRKQRIRQTLADPTYMPPPLIDETDYIAEIYQMAVFPYAGLYIGFPVLFNPAGAIPRPYGNYTALNQVELTVSYDRVHWTRVADRALFLPIDPADEAHYGWAQKLLCGTPHIHADREIWLYYNALRFRGPEHIYTAQGVPSHYLDDASALVLAKLRLDGFVSMSADESGTLTTKPFYAQGGLLWVNVAADGGEVRAELLDPATQTPLPGYGADECCALQTDTLRGRLTWHNATQLPGDRVVAVRFYLRHAHLYAYWVEHT